MLGFKTPRSDIFEWLSLLGTKKGYAYKVTN